MSEKPSQTVVENVDQVLRDEEAIMEGRSLGARIGELVGGCAGTLTFVGIQIAFVLAWVAVNMASVRAFDPFPFTLLAGILSLESVLLACFVLIKQGHEAKMSDRRSHLGLQISLLVEKEVTKLIQMMQRMSEAEGIEEQVGDDETRELGQATEMAKVVRELDRRLDGKDRE